MGDEDVAVDQENGVEQEQELTDEEQAMAKLKEAITVEKEEIGSLRLKLTVTVPQDTLDERRGEQFAELKRDAQVPGFRKGHAPLVLIEKRFASDVGDQVKTQVISNGYMAAVEKEDLKPLGDPLFWVKVTEERIGDNEKTSKVDSEKLLPIDRAIEEFEVPKSGPLTFSCEIELKPEFELPALEKIPVQRPAVSIEDEDVDGELKRMMMSRGTFQPVDKGPVKLDDMLYADMKMTVDGEVRTTEDNFDLAARDLRIKGIPFVGFGKAVVGKKAGETATFEATVPDDHEDIDIRGKTACFEFVINEIKRLVVPPVDDELLSSLGFESENELRDVLRKSLVSQLDATLNRALHSQISQYLIEKTELEIPEGLSQRQTDRAISRRMIEMYQQGMPQAEVEKNMDELRAKAHEQAQADLKLFFILERIAEDRDIVVGEEELNGAITQIARRSNKRFDRVRDELSKGDGLMTLYHQLRDQRVLNQLLDDAEVTETEGPKKTKTVKKITAKKSAPKPAAKEPAKSEKKASKKTAEKKAVAKVATANKKAAKKKTTKKKTK